MKRAVLVGCGVMGEGWLKALSAPSLAARVEVVGLVDIDCKAAEVLREKFSLATATVSDNLDTLLATLKPDLVLDVAVPSARRSLAVTALRHGCDVLTEKPMAASMDDARAILAAAQDAGRLHAVTQNRRFKTSIRRIRSFLASGALGELSSLNCDFYVGAHFGGFRDAMQHVLLLDMAIHTFDAARFMCGRDAVAVYCHESNPKGSWYAHGAAANAIFELTDDLVFTYRGSWAAEGANTSWEAAWRIIGSKGTLLWDGESTITAQVVDGAEGFFRPLRPVEVPPLPTDEGTREHESVITDFLDAIDSGRSPESVGTDNIKSLAMVFGAIESAESLQRVVISHEERP